MKELTLAAARAMVFASREQGLDCPCCDKKVKAYRRKLCLTQMVALRRVYDHLTAPGAPSTVHLGVFLASFIGTASRGGDTARLVHWGLLDKSKRGYYSITILGRAFVRGEVRIPVFKWFYNGRICEDLGGTAPLVSMQEILDGSQKNTPHNDSA